MSRLKKYTFARFGTYNSETGLASATLLRGRYAGWSAEVSAQTPNAQHLLPGMMVFVQYRICTNGFASPKLKIEFIEFGPHVERLAQLVLSQPVVRLHSEEEWRSSVFGQ